MNDIFGIDPGAPKDSRDLAALMRVLGPAEGRFIARYPAIWPDIVRKRMLELSDIEQSRFVELWMRKAQSSLLPTSAKFDKRLSWAENAETLRNSTKALIGKESDIPKVIPLSQALLDPSVFTDSRSEYVKRTAEEYVRVSRPLLLTSTRIVLVDPYFKLSFLDNRSGVIKQSHRHRGSFKALLAACVATKRVEVFCVVVNSKEALAPYKDFAVSDFECELGMVQAEAGAESIQLEYDYLEPSLFTDQHPRYLLGNTAGLHFDWGFDTGDKNTRNLVSWLSDTALEPLLDRFF